MSVKYGLLALLERQSMHGYDLRREFVDELGPEWAVNYGQIYSTLERLVRDGLVVQSETVSTDEAPDRKLYTVTPAGRSSLRQWFLTPTESVEAGRDELFAKVLLALTGDVDVKDVIQTERKGNLRRIGRMTELKERLDPDLDLAAILHLDMSIMKCEAVINWLDTAESRINKATVSEAAGLDRDHGATAPARVRRPVERTSGKRER